MITISPKHHLDYYGRVYPNAWKYVDSFRADRGKGLPWWPEWCFLPLAGSANIIQTECERLKVAPEVSKNLLKDIGVLGALAAWRVTQGIYRFDPDVFNSIIDTPISGDIPHEVFFNMPEWCIYVEAPSLTYLGVELNGFFAFLEYDMNTNRKELRFVMDFKLGESSSTYQPSLRPMVIHLGAWSLEESIKRMHDESLLHAGKKGEILPDGLVLEDLQGLMIDIVKPELEALISLLLYICSTNGEIGRGNKKPSKPKLTKTKKGLRIFPAITVRTWDVGVRMGATLRRDKAAPSETVTNSGNSHSSPRTHVRKAHWHGFWSGPRNNPEEKEYNLKWIPPIIVNGGDDADIPVTIRPVQ